MTPTNFDRFLDEQLQDPDFAERFKAAGEAWDVAFRIARLPEETGISQKGLEGVRQEPPPYKAARRRSVRL